MNNKDISYFVDRLTYLNERVEITFIDGKIIYGYFYNNIDKSETDNNEWNFVRLPQSEPLDKETILLDGNDIKSIRIIKIS